MQRAVDNVLAVTKESVKTITYESLNNIVRLINGLSALLLVILPGKASILEGMHGWELRPTFRGPRFPRWMENGVSSFNQFIHELSVDSDTSSSVDYSSGEDYSDEDGSPSTPLSQSSRVSRASSFGRHDRHWGLWARCFRCMFTWILFPVRFLMGILLYIYRASLFRGSKAATTSGNLQPSDSDTTKKADTLKDHVVQRATDRRRGLIEDLHLGIEIFIEAVFDVVHKAARCLISPLDTSRALLRWFSFRRSKDIPHSASYASVPTATLGETDPTPTERPVTFRDSLNTDGRTCRDVITELGYPYEAIRVVTADGYVLLLERIPRRDARKVVYLQHGVFDSSMGTFSRPLMLTLSEEQHQGNAGYWGMYLVDVQLGSCLFFGNHSIATGPNKWSRKTLDSCSPVLVAFSRTLLGLTGKERWTGNVHQSLETLPASIYNYNIKRT